ncbi:MAG: glycosyltransferase [Actinomycetota bacterium]
MRVLHVIATGERRGAEMFASELVGSLTETGLDQRVVVLRGSKGVSVPFNAPVMALGSDSRRRLPGLRLDPAGVKSLRDVARSWRPDVIQAHGGEALKHCVLFRSRGGSPIVYRRIGSAPPWVGGRMRRLAHGRIMRRAARVVTLAEVLRRQTIEMYGLRPERVLTIPRGVDPRRLEPSAQRDEIRRSLGVRPDAKVILSLGALTREKDPVSHVHLAARVMREMPEAIHILAGDGPLRDEVAATTARLGLAGRVLLLGNRGDVGDLLSASDVMILASRTEGMPGCLIEAGMAGLAAAAYAVAAVPEVVQDGRSGLLVRPGDLDGLTQCVLRLLTDENLRISLGREARSWCLARFDSRVISDTYLQLYRGLTSPNGEPE